MPYGWAIIFKTGENPQVTAYHALETNFEFLDVSSNSSQVQFTCQENIGGILSEGSATGGVLKLILQYDGLLFSLLVAPNGTESYSEEAICFREEISDLTIAEHHLHIAGGNGDRVKLHEANWWFLNEISDTTTVIATASSSQSSSTQATSTAGSTVEPTTVQSSSTTAKATTVISNAPPKSLFFFKCLRFSTFNFNQMSKLLWEFQL